MYMSTRGFPSATDYDWNSSGQTGQLMLKDSNYANANYIFFYFTSSQPVTATVGVLGKGEIWFVQIICISMVCLIAFQPITSSQ